MSMLSGVTKGKLKLPHLLLLYGPDGVGKSSFGAQAPSPIFLGPEKGTAELDVARFPTPKSWEDIMTACQELATATHSYKTLVIDTLDWLEPLVYSHVCKKYDTDSIEHAAGGYGKGYREAYNEMVEFRHKLTALRELKKMNIILLAHSKVTTFQDPTTESGYSRYELKLQESASVSMRSMWREYVDAVLFCNFETFSKGKGKDARGVTTRERKMWTERDAAFDAKNRFKLPYEMALDFIAYDKAVISSPDETAEDISGRIESLLKKTTDEKLKKSVSEKALQHSANPKELKRIEDKLVTMVGAL